MVEESVVELVEKLEAAASLKKHGRATKISCTVFNRPDIRLNSWKFNEWDYGKSKIQLPINARGLFIVDDEANPRIVARGYDKFFNVDEMQQTSWSSIETNTEGPYEITVKENGCIILIGGLEDGTVVVCSKHSTGPRDDVNRNHSLAGQQFLEKQLADKNINIKDFGRFLYDNNCTAVAEYCDDTFEEHILEYTKDKAGLYLHGVNYNTPEFKTWPMAKVVEFANTWGFKSIDYFTLEDEKSLRSFLTECEEKGHYNNQEIEGFVIRCSNKETKGTFFFKFKFHEPYLMYRQWREVTREYIATKSRPINFRTHNYITNKYMDFVIPLLEKDPQLAEDFMNGKGIIKLRKMFLESYDMSGLEILNLDRIKELEELDKQTVDTINEKTKFLLIPIATIGCGKTTVSLILNELFPETWGHIQNDNITKNKTDYIKCALELFKDGKQFVIADKNNHQFRERAAVFEWVRQFKDTYVPYDSNVQIIALTFVEEVTKEMEELTIQRVLKRGDNHQSIKSDSEGQQKTLKIMHGFMNRFQPFNPDKAPDSQFDFHIKLEVGKDSSMKNAVKVLQDLKSHYGDVIPEVPEDSKIQEAFNRALEYKPVVRKIVKNGNKASKNQLKPIYFSASVESTTNLIQHVVETLKKNKSALPPFLSEVSTIPFKNEYHVTLCHKSQIKSQGIKAKQLWAKYTDRYRHLLIKDGGASEQPSKVIPTEDFVTFKLRDLIWDKYVIVATIVLPDEPIVDSSNNHVSGLYCLNEVPHVTLALLSEEKKAVYAGQLAKEVYDFGINADAENDAGIIHFDEGSEETFTAKVCINV